MGKLIDAVNGGNKRDILIALRDETAATIEATTSGRDVAALSKRLIEICEMLDALPGPDEEANPIDALAAAIAEYEDDEDDDDGGD